MKGARVSYNRAGSRARGKALSSTAAPFPSRRVTMVRIS